MFKFLRQWFQKLPTLPRVEFCSSCWRGYDVSKPWIEGRNDFKICRDCLFAFDKQLLTPGATRDPTRLVLLPYSENPYQSPPVINSGTPCQMCGLHPEASTALLYNKTRVCERCIRISLQLLAESDGKDHRLRL